MGIVSTNTAEKQVLLSGQDKSGKTSFLYS